MARIPPARRAGFTFVELCIVLVIIGVLAGLVAPRAMASRDRQAARAAARDVALLLGGARQVASTTLDGAAVHFQSGAGELRVVVEGDTLRVLDVAGIHGVVLQATRDSLAYDWRGVGHGAANLTIVVRRGAAAETLVVSRLGRLRRSGVY